MSPSRRPRSPGSWVDVIGQGPGGGEERAELGRLHLDARLPAGTDDGDRHAGGHVGHEHLGAVEGAIRLREVTGQVTVGRMGRSRRPPAGPARTAAAMAPTFGVERGRGQRPGWRGGEEEERRAQRCRQSAAPAKAGPTTHGPKAAVPSSSAHRSSLPGSFLDPPAAWYSATIAIFRPAPERRPGAGPSTLGALPGGHGRCRAGRERPRPACSPTASRRSRAEYRPP